MTIPLLYFKGHFLKMTQFHTSFFFQGAGGVMFSELAFKLLESCVIYHFKGDCVSI